MIDLTDVVIDFAAARMSGTPLAYAGRGTGAAIAAAGEAVARELAAQGVQ